MPIQVHPAMLRGITAIDEVEEALSPSPRVLYAQLQAALQRWRSSTGKKRDQAMRDVLRLAKTIDAA